MTRKKAKGVKPPVAKAPDDKRRRERPLAPDFKDHLLAIPRDGGTFERIDIELREVDFDKS